MQEKLWKQICMQYDATWSIDNKRESSIEKGFSCLNCTAIDMAKLGSLYLNEGKWNNQQIVSTRYIQDACRRDTTEGSSCSFQYSISLGPKEYEIYYARGLYGQLIYMCPTKNIIIVRVGEADLKYNPFFHNHICLQILDQL